jgi:hypothetical protein
MDSGEDRGGFGLAGRSGSTRGGNRGIRGGLVDAGPRELEARRGRSRGFRLEETTMKKTILLLLLATVVACAEAAPPSPKPAEVERARTAAREMLSRLLGALQEAVGETGHASAIPVCRDAAPRIAREVGEEFGLSIGRTSHRLRNPGNLPPVWAKAAVDGIEPGARAEDFEAEAFAGETGTRGLLLPIPMKPMCVNCHGAPGEVPEDIRAVLAEHYPEDRATNFRPGELRGFVWVEWSEAE